MQKKTALEALCAHYCKTYGITGAHLFSADQHVGKCYRARGPGRPAARYPALIVSQSLPFLLLASQRRTRLSIDQVAECLYLDEWDTLDAAAEAETRLATDPEFALAFEQFLDSFDGDQRSQASNVASAVAMTYQQVAAELGCSWQYVQQIEKKALRKLRNNPEVIEMLTGGSLT